MKHEYRGFTYRLAVRNADTMEFLVYKKAWIFLERCHRSPDFDRKPDESDEGLIVRVHTEAKEYIDTLAGTIERRAKLENKADVLTKELEFMGRLMK